jgi:phosphatidylinositol-3,4,5-trisphosphate 3-phosphatase/dual-specificity protein phosphatase PTEN
MENNNSKNIFRTPNYLEQLQQETEQFVEASISSENHLFGTNFLKSIVSKKKRRFEHEGFNLDLSYITKNIIAMGFPASNLEKFYRNDMNEVKRFMTKRHNSRHKVYNLCLERSYPNDSFYKQVTYGYPDHEAPMFEQLIEFCKDVDEWLKEHPENMAVIHCKAGKGRTGTNVCCYLLYSGIVRSAEDAMKYYGIMRTENGKGVTIPSQIRYIYYFEHAMNASIRDYSFAPVCRVTKIKFNIAPLKACRPYFKAKNGEIDYNYKDNHKIQRYSNKISIELVVKDLTVSGDVRLEFFSKKTISKDKLFTIFFNTLFIPTDGVLVVKKSMLDKAHKDVDNKVLDPKFKLEIHFVFKNQENEYTELDKDFKRLNFIGS